MLLRRYRKAKELKDRNENSIPEEELKLLKNEQLKKLLDEKGIEYDSKAKKEDLIKLLEGAE